MDTVKFTLNGEEKELLLKSSWNLLYVIREVYGLTGTKYGCGTNDCGVCKVLVDYKPVNSCVYPMRKAEGKNILTIEGINSIPEYSVIADSFVEAHAVQCGFCTPGMIVTTLGLFIRNPSPTEKEIIEAFNSNLCRCTGYINIIKAVKLIAEKTKDWENEKWKR